MAKKISIVLIIIAAFLLFGQVENSGFQLVKQYYECKNLVMIPNNFSYTHKHYYPDPNVPNNRLNDTFYQRIGLQNMTFDQAMSLFRTIFMEIRSCPRQTPFLCNCVNSLFSGTTVDQSVLFRNETVFAQVKLIVNTFITKFRPFLVSSQNGFLSDWFFHGHDLPTLIQFFFNYDYTTTRLLFYNESLTACQIDRMEKVIFLIFWLFRIISMDSY